MIWVQIVVWAVIYAIIYIPYAQERKECKQYLEKAHEAYARGDREIGDMYMRIGTRFKR